MKVVWMIFYFRDKSITELKSFSEPEYHSFSTLEPWDDTEYHTEEEAIAALRECELDAQDRVLIQKVYVKA